MAVYLDSSAFLKLLLDEPEEDALWARLEQSETWISSVLLEVEAKVTLRRLRGTQAVDAALVMLPLVDMVEIDADVRRIAGDLDHPGLRSLDAIHLATALSLDDRCDTFFAYDERLLDAARAHGLAVSAPA